MSSAPSPATPSHVTGGNLHFLAPGDIATMYDITALYSAGIDGTGQTLAVIGQTDVYLTDLAYLPIRLRSFADQLHHQCQQRHHRLQHLQLPVRVHRRYRRSRAPNTIDDDLPEADIDIEWSGATARNAQIIYVNAPDPSGGGVWDSLVLRHRQ